MVPGRMHERVSDCALKTCTKHTTKLNCGDIYLKDFLQAPFIPEIQSTLHSVNVRI